MGSELDFYPGRRISYDGALCTVRGVFEQVAGTKGTWLGVEWDEPSRGKHDGVHNGKRYFDVRSHHLTVGSFVRPNRKQDPERIVLEAIKTKYALSGRKDSRELVIISGKIAEEVGFERVAKEQSLLAELRIILINQHVVNGVATRRSTDEIRRREQHTLSQQCQNATELDLSYNVIETWKEVEDICTSLPKLRLLKLNGLRLRDLNPRSTSSEGQIFSRVEELHLNGCLLTPTEICTILGDISNPIFPALHTLSLSHNELSNFTVASEFAGNHYERIVSLSLDNNEFDNLDVLAQIATRFPNVRHVSLQRNNITNFGPPQTSRLSEALESLNVSHNKIHSFEFVDRVPSALPSLHALHLSSNPVYDNAYHATQNVNAAETNYYLTLARIPKLRTLNYTSISTREREEGEIYYLSVCETEIRSIIAAKELTAQDSSENQQAVIAIENRFPQFARLCLKHERENILQSLLSSTSTSAFVNKPSAKPVYPLGSLAARSVTATFYIPPQFAESIFARLPASGSDLPNDATANTTPTAPVSRAFSRTLTTSLSSSQVFSLVSRTLHLLPLQFKLIYESTELDPADDNLTTRSQLYTKDGKLKSSESDGQKDRWAEWGDWDADALVESSIPDPDSTVSHTGNSSSMNDGDGEGSWKDDILSKDGKKWKRREIVIDYGMRAWGDFLENEIVDTVVTVRVEPFTTFYR